MCVIKHRGGMKLVSLKIFFKCHVDEQGQKDPQWDLLEEMELELKNLVKLSQYKQSGYVVLVWYDQLKAMPTRSSRMRR